MEPQLERGRLDGERVVRLGCGHRERMPEVTARDRVESGRAHHARNHLGGGGLAVRAGDRDVRNAAQPSADVELAPDRDAAFDRPPKDLGVLGDARARHDRGRAVQMRGVVATVIDAHAQRAQLVSVRHARRVGEANLGAVAGEHDRGAAAGDARADDDDAFAREGAHPPDPARTRKSA
jgi:hypothetical protein